MIEKKTQKVFQALLIFTGITLLSYLYSNSTFCHRCKENILRNTSWYQRFLHYGLGVVTAFAENGLVSESVTFTTVVKNKPYHAIILNYYGPIASVQSVMNNATKSAIAQSLAVKTTSNIARPIKVVRQNPRKQQSFNAFMEHFNSEDNVVTIVLHWDMGNIIQSLPFEVGYQAEFTHTFSPMTCQVLQHSMYRYIKGGSEHCKNHTNYSEYTRMLITPNFFAHGLYSKDVDLYIHIIRDASVDSLGTVQTNDGRFTIVAFQCTGHSINFKKSKTPVATYSMVFVISQFWGEGYFHSNLENIPRLMTDIEFLKENKDVMIHVVKINSHMKTVCTMLGLGTERLVSGAIRAQIVILPQGGGCGGAIPYSLLLLAHEYKTFIDDYNGSTHAQKKVPVDGDTALTSNMPLDCRKRNRNRIILIQRTQNRGLKQHSQIAKFLHNVSQAYGTEFFIFTDKKLPTFIETGKLFRKSFLVVAPHGAGLSNIVFMDPGSVVIEILCNSKQYINLCNTDTSRLLGLRYHGILATSGCGGGMAVDLSYLFKVVEFFVNDTCTH